jgi:hypothetical protein
MELNSTAWRTSSYTGGNGGNCVEVGNDEGGVVVRDTKARAGEVLAFTPQAWRELTAHIKDANAR